MKSSTGRKSAGLEKRILEPFFRRNDILMPLERLQAALSPVADLWVAGGAPRNAIIESLHGRAPVTEDIDVFIGNVDPHLRLHRLDLEGEVRRTELGGIRWLSRLSPFAFDISLLARFVIIDKFRMAPTPQSLLSAIDFDVNAVMWCWQRRQALAASDCIAAIDRKVMDFNTPLVFDKLLLAYRILVISHKIHFALSERVFDYAKTALDLGTLNRLRKILVAKLGEPAAAQVMSGYNAICRCRSHEAYMERFAHRKTVLFQGFSVSADGDARQGG